MELKIKRNPRYFELNVIMPGVLLSLLMVQMFLLPVDSGEKISLGKHMPIMESFCRVSESIS